MIHRKVTSLLEITKKSLLAIPIITSFFAQGQLVENGDFEQLSSWATPIVTNQPVWTSVFYPVAPSSAFPAYSSTISFADGWNSYHFASTQGIDFYIDARGWGGNYRYDPWNHVGGSGPDFFPPYSVPGEMGTNQASGNAMLVDGNPSNGYSAYPHLEPSSQPNANVLTTQNEFIEGRFTQKLDLFKKYRMTFKYSIPCNNGPSSGGGDDIITINLFDKELIDANSPSSYANDYLSGTVFNSWMNINSSTFNWDIYQDINGFDTYLQGSHRLMIHQEVIPDGVNPCEWNTVTFEFCIADFMADPNLNTLLGNPLYNNLPLSYMHNGHMLDVDFYNANQAGWPYSYTQNTTLAYFIENVINPSGLRLFNFKEVFGVTLKGGEAVYLDDFSVEEVECALDTDFTVNQSCSLVNGQPMVTFELTPNGPNYNPYIFKMRNVTNNGAWTQIFNSTVPLGGVHTVTVPYIAGEQYSFICGSWSQGSNDCGWTEESKTITVDPQGNWFATTPNFSLQGLTYSGFPPSWFGILATPGNQGLTSVWEYQIEYDNQTISNWMPVSTSANPNGNGNNDFIIWFDCNDAYFPFLKPNATHSNVKVVNVKRTNYGSCALEGVNQIRSFVHCVQSGKAQKSNTVSSDITNISRSELAEIMGTDIPEEEITLFPNPASSEINIHFEIASARIINLVTLGGKEVIPSFQTEDQLVQLNLTNLSSGVYLLNIRTVDGVQVKRIIKK